MSLRSLNLKIRNLLSTKEKKNVYRHRNFQINNPKQKNVKFKINKDRKKTLLHIDLIPHTYLKITNEIIKTTRKYFKIFNFNQESEEGRRRVEETRNCLSTVKSKQGGYACSATKSDSCLMFSIQENYSTS